MIKLLLFIISITPSKMLELHNRARAEVGSPPLVLNQELSQYAQQWADHLAKTEPHIYHSNRVMNGKQVGENIFWSSNREVHGVIDAWNAWYDEKLNYKYGPVDGVKRPYKIGHYTQIVWKNAKEMGMGVAYSEKGIVVVCSYYPHGNIINEYPY
jgi:uncharacterized protein YkwD